MNTFDLLSRLPLYETFLDHSIRNFDQSSNEIANYSTLSTIRSSNGDLCCFRHKIAIVCLYDSEKFLFDNKNVEIEFEEEISAAFWAPDSSLLVIGDCSGVTHFVSRHGHLYFSHKFSLTDCKIVKLYGDDLSAGSILVVVNEDLTVNIIRNFSFSLISKVGTDNPDLFSQAARVLKCSSHRLNFGILKKLDISRLVGSTTIIFTMISDHHELYCYHLDVSSPEVELNPFLVPIESQSPHRPVTSDITFVSIPSLSSLICVFLLDTQLYFFDCRLKKVNYSLNLGRRFSCISRSMCIASEITACLAFALDANDDGESGSHNSIVFIRTDGDEIRYTNHCDCGLLKFSRTSQSGLSRMHGSLSGSLSVCNMSQIMYSRCGVIAGYVWEKTENSDFVVVDYSQYFIHCIASMVVGFETGMNMNDRFVSLMVTNGTLAPALLGVIASFTYEMKTDEMPSNALTMSEKVMSGVFQVLSGVQNPKELLLVIQGLFSIPFPPKNSLEKILQICRNKFGSMFDSHQSSRIEFDRLVHQLSTSILLTGNSFRFSNSDEDIRQTFHRISDLQCGNTWLNYITLGDLFGSSLLYSRHQESIVKYVTSLGSSEFCLVLLSRVPLDVHAQTFVQWIKDVLVPLISITTFLDTTSTEDWFWKLCKEISMRSLHHAGNVYETKLLLECALDLSHKTQCNYHVGSISADNVQGFDITGLTNGAISWSFAVIESLFVIFSIQCEIFSLWRCSIEELCEYGLQYFVFEELLTHEINSLDKCIANLIIPLIAKFGASFDRWVDIWIEDVVSSKLVLSDDDHQLFLEGNLDRSPNYDNMVLASSSSGSIDESELVSLYRLTIVTSHIQDPGIRAQEVLKLLQLPAAYTLAVSKNDSESLSNRNSVHLLCELATHCVNEVSSTLRESLSEAVRLKKMRSLALKYGITDFDPRNSMQIRYSCNIIANHIFDEDSIKDAVTLATAWGSDSVDIHLLFTRSALHRACYHFDDLSLQMKSLECILKNIRSDILSSVIEDIVSNLLCHLDATIQKICELHSVTHSNRFVILGFDTYDGSETELEHHLESITRVLSSTIFIITWFLDQTKAVMDNYGSLEKYLGDLKSWVNFDFLCSMKDLQSLFVEFGVLISFQNYSNSGVCEEILFNIAFYHYQQIVQNYFMIDSMVSSTIKKLCGLLRHSIFALIEILVQLAVEDSQFELSLSLGRLLLPNEEEATNELSSVSWEQDVTHIWNISTNLGKISSLSPSESSYQRNRKFFQQDTNLHSNQSLFDAAVSIFDVVTPTLEKRDHSQVEKFPSSQELVDFHHASFELSSQLLMGITSTCNLLSLGQTLRLLNTSEIFLSVLERSENHAIANRSMFHGFAKPWSVPRNSDTNHTNMTTNASNGPGASSSVPASTSISFFSLSDTFFSRDGILIPSDQIRQPLLSFLYHESKRKSSNRIGCCSHHAEEYSDIESLVRILQKTENNMLAMRVILGSSASFSFKNKKLMEPMISLSRKLLGYRDVDSSLVISVMIALPFDQIVKEIQRALPSIQSDFVRLQTVATLGEEISRLFAEENLTVFFQGLQTNAKWWHIFTGKGIKLDPKFFQNGQAESSDHYIRSLVPILFSSSNFNLPLTLEFCRQFHIEPEYAYVQYIEKIFTSKPTSPLDSSWLMQFGQVSGLVEEKAILSCFRRILHQLHDLDYEKINYVCRWLHNFLSDDIASSISDSNGSSVSIANELSTYQRYSEMIMYLSTLQLKDMRGVPNVKFEDIFEGLTHDSYYHRLPVWIILEDPWSVLEPLFESAMDTMNKLGPLCSMLHIDRDEFQTRRIMAWYHKESQVLRDSIDKENHGSVCHSFLTRIRQEVSLIPTIRTRIDLWKWIFEKERSRDHVFAQSAIEEAIDLVNRIDYRHNNSSTDEMEVEMEDIHNLQSNLVLELVKLQCERSVEESSTLIQSKFSSNSMLQLCTIDSSFFDNYLSNLEDMIKNMLDILVIDAWNLQVQDSLDHLFPYSNSVFAIIMRHQLLPSVLSYLQIAGNLITNIVQHCNLLIHNESRVFNLEDIRGSLISRLLVDVDQGNDVNKENQRSSLRNRSDFLGSSILVPSIAEIRRKEDLYMAFSCVALIVACDNGGERDRHLSYLNSIGRGDSSKALRRLTFRSRLRAILAICFTGHSNDNNEELNRMLKSSLCLAEMHEIRIPCLDNTLYEALGYGIETKEGLLQLHVRQDANVMSLVKTWLHDEGDQPCVMEMCRDLMILTSHFAVESWDLYLHHLTSKNMHRQLFTAVSRLLKSTPSNDILSSNNAKGIMSITLSCIDDSLDRFIHIVRTKSEQVTSENVAAVEKKISGSLDLNSSIYFTSGKDDLRRHEQAINGIDGAMAAPLLSKRHSRPRTIKDIDLENATLALGDSILILVKIVDFGVVDGRLFDISAIWDRLSKILDVLSYFPVIEVGKLLQEDTMMAKTCLDCSNRLLHALSSNTSEQDFCHRLLSILSQHVVPPLFALLDKHELMDQQSSVLWQIIREISSKLSFSGFSELMNSLLLENISHPMHSLITILVDGAMKSWKLGDFCQTFFVVIFRWVAAQTRSNSSSPSISYINRFMLKYGKFHSERLKAAFNLISIHLEKNDTISIAKIISLMT